MEMISVYEINLDELPGVFLMDQADVPLDRTTFPSPPSDLELSWTQPISPSLLFLDVSPPILTSPSLV